MNDHKALDPLKSAKYMLERAGKHIAEFKRELDLFGKSRPCKTVTEFDADDSLNVTKLRLVKPLPGALAGIMFDAVNNLRACLDQLGYATATAANSAFGRHAKFPFGTDEQNARSFKGGPSTQIPDAIFDLIMSFRPYESGDRTLWAINKICNTKKHNRIIDASVQPSGIRLGRVRCTGYWSAPGEARWDRQKQEIEVVRFEPGATFLEWKVNVQLYVGFCDVAGLGNDEVFATLCMMKDVVERILVAVESEAKRLGLFKQ